MKDVIENPFYDDWRDCLRAHYQHVIYEGDENNADSLATVLQDTGFNERELAVLRTTILAEIGVVPSEELADFSDADEVTVTDQVMEIIPEIASEVSQEPVAEVALETDPEPFSVETEALNVEDQIMVEVLDIDIAVPVETVQEVGQAVEDVLTDDSGEVESAEIVEAPIQQDTESPRQMSLF